MAASNHFPTSFEMAETIADLTDEQLFDVFCGKKSILEDPRTQRIVVRDTDKINPGEMKQRVDIAKHLAHVMVEQRPELLPRVADAVRMAVQLAPQLLAEARNEVRRSHNLSPIVEPNLVEGAMKFNGKVTAQNESQTVITDTKGLKSYLLDNASMSSLPKRDSTVRVERAADGGKLQVTELSLGRDQGGGLGR